MAKIKNDEGQYVPCLVCNAPASEMDHFPLQRQHGGKETVPLCIGCHDLKDRINTEDAIALFMNGYSALWTDLNRDGRLSLMKIMNAMAHINARKEA